MEEVEVALPRAGITLRGVRSGDRGDKPVLCLHGWLDNCASFEPLFARLNGRDLLAVDLPGHGLSDPIPSATCHYLDYAACALELTCLLGWSHFDLIGHSLGGALSSLIAGIHPERVIRLVLLDAIGPLPAGPEQSRQSVARFLTAYLNGERSPTYLSREQAVAARVQLADIAPDTADRLVERDLHASQDGWRWRSDDRLRYPFALTFTEHQILAYLRAITAPTLLVTAERSALVESFYPARVSAVPSLRQVTLPGGHHLHMEHPDLVSQEIAAFLGTTAAVSGEMDATDRDVLRGRGGSRGDRYRQPDRDAPAPASFNGAAPWVWARRRQA